MDAKSKVPSLNSKKHWPGPWESLCLIPQGQEECLGSSPTLQM